MGPNENLPGLDKAAILFNILGPRLASQLFPALTEAQVVQVRQRASMLGDIPFDMKKQVLEEFYFSFMSEKFSAGNKKEERSQPFAFLEGLSEIQLGYLIRSEEPRAVAILLAQLPVEMQSNLLDRLPAEVRAPAIVDLGHIKDIPLEAVLEIAAEFSEKAKQIPPQAEYEEGGGKAMAGLLGTMDSKDQTQFLEYLSQEDPELAKEVRKHHFTFDNIVMLPDHILRDVFNSMDLDDVALALKGQDEELTQRILESLPQKKQAMYEAREGPVPRKQVEAAQKKVVEMIMQMDADPANDFSIEQFVEADFIE